MDDKIREFEENFSVLDRYGEDVTKQEFITNPAIGRDQQLKELILILLTPEKSAILIGKPGIGKTAIVEGLAWMLQKGDVPDALKGYTIINIKTASLLGTMPSGESKVQKMIDELKTKEKVILFVDEVHMLIGATDSSSLDFANIFKEGLGRGSIKVIGATTTEEYERYILRDKAFTRRFQKVEVPEPTTEETIKIMMGTLPKFEKQTGKKMKYTSFIQERIMTFLVDITSEYKRVYALGSRYPDVCLTLLKQAFSYTVYDNRDYMDIFDVRKAIENSKNIYPDVIKKNLPIFDKTFNDIILEEKGEKPIEEWRKEVGPTRFEQEQVKKSEQGSSSISYGDISANIIKSLTGKKEENDDTVGDDMDNGTQIDNQNTMNQQMNDIQNMNQMNPMMNQQMMGQMMNQQIQNMNPMMNQGMYQQNVNQMNPMMNQGMYQQDMNQMNPMMNQGMYQLNMNQMNPMMNQQMMGQMMNQQIQNMNPMMNQMQNGSNDSQQNESTDVFDDVGENTATHILTDFSAPKNRDNRKKREPRRRNNNNNAIDNLSYVPNMVDKKQLKNMEPVKGIMSSKALRGINESFDSFGSQSTFSSSSDLDDLLLGGGIKTLENHKESELDFAKRVTKSNDLEMSKSSVLIGDSIASTLDMEDVDTEPVARYKSGNFTGRTSGTGNNAFMYDDDDRRTNNRNKGQFNGRFLSDDDGNNRIQATLDRINPPRNDNNNDYYNDGRDFMNAMSDVNIQNGRITEGKKRRRPRNEEYYDEEDDGDYYEDNRYDSKRRDNNSSYINFSNINELASEESRKEKRYFVPESEKIMNSLMNNNQNDDNDDNNGRNNMNQVNNFDLNSNGIDDRQELAMLQNMYQQAMMNNQMMNQQMMNQMNQPMMPQQQMNQPMMGQNQMMNQQMMNNQMMGQNQMMSIQMNQPMMPQQQINQPMKGQQNQMMNQPMTNKPPVDLTLNENDIDDFFDE